ncbi:MAG: hypothetical protein QOD97_3795 [Mycobacterium sp.]|nr:hypothetical protein [Mycobacterium sp.]
MTFGGPPEQPQIRRQPDDSDPKTNIIRRQPTGSFPQPSVPPVPSADEPPTSFIPPSAPRPDDPHTSGHLPLAGDYIPRPTPVAIGSPGRLRPSPVAASITAAVSIISGWATGVIATSLIAGWWRTDELFCVAIGFLTAVSAGATIGGLIALLLRRRIGRVLILVGSAVSLMIFAGLFVAGAELPPIVYGIPALPIASVLLAFLPATGRWAR